MKEKNFCFKDASLEDRLESRVLPAITLVGLGKMGRLIQQSCQGTGQFPSVDPKEGDFPVLSAEALQGTEVVIDFTNPKVVMENIRFYCELGVSAVIGTTGWEGGRSQVENWVKEAGIGLVYGSNFSLGVQLFYRMVRHAARLIGPFTSYDASIREEHHCHKKDAPSGTAHCLGDILLEELPRKDRLFGGEGAPDPNELHISAARRGMVTGVHEVSFDSSVDSIRLEHRAHSREGYAQGALHAAHWIAQKKGFYSFDEVLSSLWDEPQKG